MDGASSGARLTKDVRQAFDVFPPERARAYASALRANLLAAGPPDHARLRRLVHLRRLVDAAEPGSAVDLLDAYALPLPITLICDLLLLADAETTVLEATVLETTVFRDHRQPPPREAALIRSRTARIVTDALAPANVLIGLFVLVGWHAAGGQADAARGLAGAAWGLGAAAVSAGLPLLAVLAGVRRGWWTDVHVSVREQRMVPLAVAIGANLAGLGLLALAHAPRPLLALVLAVLGGLVAGAAITAGWKISGHTGAAAAAMTVLAASYGPWTLLALPLVALIAWSRVAAGDHTWAQAAGGLLLGAAVAAGVFIPLSLIRRCL